MAFNKMLVAVLVAASALCAPLASATVIDTVESTPNDEILNNGNPQLIFTHNLLDNGFVLGSTIYSSGLLRIRLTDGGSSTNTSNESGFISVGDQTLAITPIDDGTRNDPTPAGKFFDIVLNSVSLADLNADGMLSVSLNRTSGNFAFADSSLSLEIQQAVVPEPLSIALFGVGMAGLCLGRRRTHKA